MDLAFRHLRTLTDDTGVLQHATYSIPNRDHGYCVDDNARALIAACEGARLGYEESIEPLVPIYLGFLMHALNREHGRFRNFMGYDRRWLDEMGSEDSHGRALWGLGVASTSAPFSSQRELASRLFEEGMEAVGGFQSLRALAFTILGLDRFLQHRTTSTPASALLEKFSGTIHDAFICNRDDAWHWCEDVLTYSNAVLPLALIVAAQRLDRREMLDDALASLRWLFESQLSPDGHLSIVGNDGWMRRGGERARFDQQPVDVAALVYACTEAYAVTGDDTWLERGRVCFDWFLGSNDLGIPIYDASTGGCCDGLHSFGVNANQGAESTIVWLIARFRMEEIMESWRNGVDEEKKR